MLGIKYLSPEVQIFSLFVYSLNPGNFSFFSPDELTVAFWPVHIPLRLDQYIVLDNLITFAGFLSYLSLHSTKLRFFLTC